MDMTRDGLANAVALGIDGAVSFNEMGVDSQNDILGGVDALLALYEENQQPDEDTIMRVFASAYENSSPDTSEWDEDYKREMHNVANFVRAYSRIASKDKATTTSPRRPRRTSLLITEVEVDDPSVVPEEMENLDGLEQSVVESAVFLVLAVQRMDDEISVDRSWARSEAELWVHNLEVTQGILARTECRMGFVDEAVTKAKAHLDAGRGFAALFALRDWAVKTLIMLADVHVDDADQWRRVCATYGTIIPEGRW